MRSKIIYILFLLPIIVYAQGPQKALSGKVISGVFVLKGILVVNMNAQIETRTNSVGEFTIAAKTGDSIIVTNPGIVTKRWRVSENHFKTSPLVVTVEMNQDYVMEEIVIEKDNSLTSESLGLVPKGQKVYTPAERKLYTAGDFKAIHLLSILGGSLAIDPILNAINGRTKQRKAEIEVEKKETGLALINGIYTEQQIIEEFKIPKEYVNGFLYYCIEDVAFADAVRQKNETLMKFLMAGLSVKYVEIIEDEK